MMAYGPGIATPQRVKPQQWLPIPFPHYHDLLKVPLVPINPQMSYSRVFIPVVVILRHADVHVFSVESQQARRVVIDQHRQGHFKVTVC